MEETLFTKQEHEVISLKVAIDVFDSMLNHNVLKLMGDEFSNLGDPTVVVLTENKNPKPAKNIIFVNTPGEALDALKRKGFKSALVGGGGKINSAFMKEGLVNDIYLDVEPMIFGKGIKLFSDADFEAKLELIEIKKLSKNEIQLHYKVKK